MMMRVKRTMTMVMTMGLQLTFMKVVVMIKMNMMRVIAH